MDAPEPTRRPWLTHERMVLLIVAMIAAMGLGYGGWEVSIVRQRRHMRDQIEATGGEFDNPFTGAPLSPMVTIRPAATNYSVSKVRAILGDKQVELIEFPRPLTTSDRRAIEAFPEAEVQGIPESTGARPAKMKSSSLNKSTCSDLAC